MSDNDDWKNHINIENRQVINSHLANILLLIRDVSIFGVPSLTFLTAIFFDALLSRGYGFPTF